MRHSGLLGETDGLLDLLPHLREVNGCRREPQAPAVHLGEHHADAPFGLLQPVAGRRLAERQRLGCSTELAFVANGDEKVEMATIQRFMHRFDDKGRNYALVE